MIKKSTDWLRNNVSYTSLVSRAIPATPVSGESSELSSQQALLVTLHLNSLRMTGNEVGLVQFFFDWLKIRFDTLVL